MVAAIRLGQTVSTTAPVRTTANANKAGQAMAKIVSAHVQFQMLIASMVVALLEIAVALIVHGLGMVPLAKCATSLPLRVLTAARSTPRPVLVRTVILLLAEKLATLALCHSKTAKTVAS